MSLSIKYHTKSDPPLVLALPNVQDYTLHINLKSSLKTYQVCFLHPDTSPPQKIEILLSHLPALLSLLYALF